MLVPPVGWTVDALFHLLLAALEGCSASESSREGEQKQSDELHRQCAIQAGTRQYFLISCIFVVLTYDGIALTETVGYVLDTWPVALRRTTVTELANETSSFTCR